MNRWLRSVVLCAAFVSLSAWAGLAAPPLSFPYVDVPNTTYSFRIQGTLGGALLSNIAQAETANTSAKERRFSTLVTVTTGAKRRDDTFDLTLKGETAWSPLSEASAPLDSVASKFAYKFVLNREGRVVTSDAPGIESGGTFNAWDFIWSALARVRPKSAPRRVTPGSLWTEEFSTNQTLSSTTMRTSFKSSFTFARLEPYRGHTAALITERGEGMVTTYKRSQEPPDQTRLYTAGRIWAEPASGLIRYAEWSVDAEPLASSKGSRPSAAKQRNRALTLACTLLTYSTRQTQSDSITW